MSICEVEPGELLTLLGPSGCGKTTTLRMIAGFQEPSGGRIFIAGRDVTHVPANARDIGFVFQNYALFPHLTIFGNVAYGLQVRQWSTADISRAVDEVLELVGLAGFGERLAERIVRRPAAARRAGAGDRDPSPRAAVRRTALQSRCKAAGVDARRDQASAADAEDHHRLRHPRPGRGDGDFRPHRRDGRRAGSRSSIPPKRFTGVRPRPSSPASSAAPICCAPRCEAWRMAGRRSMSAARC